MPFVRGFKTWCENTSKNLRRELGLASSDPMDSFSLAAHMGVTVWQAEEVPGVDKKTLNTLLRDDPESWSALTVHAGAMHAVILNSTHSGGRPASNLAHELAHMILDHAPARVDVSEDGLLMLQSFDRLQEDEATWLAGCLLLPRVALAASDGAGNSIRTIAKRFGVSPGMVKYRLNVTGVNAQRRAAIRKGDG